MWIWDHGCIGLGLGELVTNNHSYFALKAGWEMEAIDMGTVSNPFVVCMVAITMGHPVLQMSLLQFSCYGS